MMKALGLIESVGLTTAMESADAALKAADVELLGLENARGGGKITVKVQGDVGAVKAAVEAAVKAAGMIGTVSSHLVLAKPYEEVIEHFGKNQSISYEQKADPEPGREPELEHEAEPECMTEQENDEICNLCGDPRCPRKKGEPHNNCIHYSNSL